MPDRNPEIQRIFEIADDALQGLVGFHLFVDAAIESAPDTSVRIALPKEEMFITPDWNRFYNREDLLQFMRRWFSPIFYRNLFVGMVSYFDAASKDIFKCLLDKYDEHDIGCSNKDSYKKRLESVFKIVRNSQFGYPQTLIQIPKFCLDVDHARRLRNIIAHNNGRIDDRYENDCIDVGKIFETSDLSPHFDKAIDSFRANPSQAIPIIIKYERYYESVRNHIRLLHLFHNEVQLQYYDYPDGYSYQKEGKSLEWHRVFFGV
jgi:hypothetical protein